MRCQIRCRDARFGRQRMVAADENAHRVRPDAVLDECRVCRCRQRDHRDLALAVGNAATGGLGIHEHDLRLDLRVALHERAQHRRHAVQPHMMRKRQPQIARDFGTEVVQRASAILQCREQFAGVRQPRPPGLGKCYPTADAVEQRMPEALFEGGQALADRGLAQMQRFAGCLKRTQVTDSHKRTNRVGLHGFNSCEKVIDYIRKIHLSNRRRDRSLAPSQVRRQ